MADETKQSEWTKEISQALLAPFADGIVRWREGKFAYIEARDVMARLDEVVGPGNWHFRCEAVQHQQEGIGAVVKGSLTVLGVTREDYGEHWRTFEKDKVETYKSAVSDALKRVAVHFGIGRYLYELELERAGQMTQEEAFSAARRAGYTANPEVHDFPCSTCGADVDIELARKCQRTYGGRVFCVKHKGEMDEGIEAQKARPVEAKPVTATKCSNCPRPLTQGVLTTSTRVYKKPLCMPCQQEESKAKVSANKGGAPG